MGLETLSGRTAVPEANIEDCLKVLKDLGSADELQTRVDKRLGKHEAIPLNKPEQAQG